MFGVNWMTGRERGCKCAGRGVERRIGRENRRKDWKSYLKGVGLQEIGRFNGGRKESFLLQKVKFVLTPPRPCVSSPRTCTSSRNPRTLPLISSLISLRRHFSECVQKIKKLTMQFLNLQHVTN